MKEREKKPFYFPQVREGCERETEPRAEERRGIYPCPCCGYLTFPVPKEEAVAYICPVCFWENDVFITCDEEPSDENHGLSLREGQRTYRAFGACDQRMLPHVRKPRPEEYPG